MSGVDSTTAKSAGSRAGGLMTKVNPATLAVYLFVALLAALIVFGAVRNARFPEHRQPKRNSHLRRIRRHHRGRFDPDHAVRQPVLHFAGHDDRHYRDPVHVPAALWRGRGDPRHAVGGNRHFAVQGALVGLIGANPIIVTIGAGAIQEGIIGWLPQATSRRLGRQHRVPGAHHLRATLFSLCVPRARARA